MAELLLLLFGSHAEDVEHPRLQIALVNSDRAAAKLHAIEDNVVRFSADLGELSGFKFRDVVCFWPGERMMDGIPFLFRGVESQQLKIDNPEEIELL